MENNQTLPTREEFATLSTRIANLETHNRFLWIGGSIVSAGLVALLIATVFLAGKSNSLSENTPKQNSLVASRTEPTLEANTAHSFTLLDHDEKVRWQVSVVEGEGVFERFYDKNGKIRAVYGIDPTSESYLCLYDGKETPKLSLHVAPDKETAGINILPSVRNLNRGISIDCDEKGHEYIGWHDAEGNARALH